MKESTLKEFKKRAREFSDMYETLIDLWNGDLEHGNNATYPVTIVVGNMIHNIAFDGSNCVGYSHDKAVRDVEKNLNGLKEVNEYENKMYMTHYPYCELSALYDGLVMSEDYE